MSRVNVFKGVSLFTALIVGVVLVELHYRYQRIPVYWKVEDLQKPADEKKLPFTFDPDFGFRPVLDGNVYNEFATHVNEYASAKRPGATRLLFVGDSVTDRAKLIDAIRDLYGTDAYEYWNAGVAGFDPTQEVLLYERYNHRIEPDHVILTLHNNDFDPQPVVDFDDDGHITVFDPAGADRTWMPWPLRDSAVVRHKVVKRWRKQRWADGTNRVRASLAKLKRRLDDDHVPLTVILLPSLKSLDTWEEKETESRRRSLAILDALEIHYVDLIESLKEALANGVDVCQVPGDAWHPSDQAAEYFARQLRAENLLERDHESVAAFVVDESVPIRKLGANAGSSSKTDNAVRQANHGVPNDRNGRPLLDQRNR